MQRFWNVLLCLAVALPVAAEKKKPIESLDDLPRHMSDTFVMVSD